MRSVATKFLLGLLTVWSVSLTATAADFAAARPVWPQDRTTERNLSVGFRMSVDGPSLRGGFLRYTGSSVVRVWLNGEVLSYGPARGPHGFDRVEEVALSTNLAGVCEFAFEVAGYNVDSFYLLNEPAYLQAEIVAADGRVLAATDASTSAGILEARVQKVPRYSYQRPFCEVYRLSPDSNAWRTGKLASPVKLATVAGSDLLPRVFSVPPLKISRNFRPLFIGTLDYRADQQPIRGRSVFGENDPRRGYSEQECVLQPTWEVQRLNHELTRVACEATNGVLPFAERCFALYDHGLCDTGFIGATVKCERPGRLYFVFDELLTGNDVNPNRQSWECVSTVSVDFTAPGEYRFESFEPNTFRYLKILSDGFAGEVGGLYLREYKNGDVTATFDCSDDGLNRVFAAATETFAQNAVDAFTDCPSRERAGWLCDSFFTGRAALYLTGRTNAERGFLQDYALCSKSFAGGFLPMCYPADSDLLPNWNFFLVLELEEYLRRSGDRELVDAFRPQVERLLAALRRFRNSDGLLERLPGWVFVEWSRANALVQDVNYPSNMTYAETLDAVARLYGMRACAEEAEHVRETVRRQSWTGEWFCDNAVRQPDGTLKLSGECTETCQYYAFFFGTATKERYPELWRRLVEDFGPARKRDPKANKWPKIHPSNAFIGNYLRLECLSREGLSKRILDETKGYLLRQADLTGTLWEHDGTHASLCHGFASHVAVSLYRDVLGVRALDPLAKTVTLSVPQDLPLDFCRGEIPTADGFVKVEWRREGGEVKSSVSVPQGWRVGGKEK